MQDELELYLIKAGVNNDVAECFANMGWATVKGLWTSLKSSNVAAIVDDFDKDLQTLEKSRLLLSMKRSLSDTLAGESGACNHPLSYPASDAQSTT